MTKSILPLIGFCLIQVLAIGQKTTPVYEFKNGNWYNGEGFTPGTWYTVDGKFTKKTPAKVDSVFDLAGRWVVPPLADAYCSTLTGNPSAANQLGFCTEEGIFYLQVLGNSLEDRKAVEALVNKPSGPDVAFANGGVTCSLGYPFLQFEGPAQGIRNPQLMKQQYDKIKLQRSMEGNGYWYMDSKAAVGKAWDKIKAQRPNLISIYLLDVANSGGKEGKGLSADVAKEVVKKAHKSGFPVYAHVETAADVALGLKLGVDGFANLPGHKWDGSGDGKKYELSDDDLKKLAKKKTPVIPLFSHAQSMAPRQGSQEAQSKMLKRLLSNGVNVVIGSDDIQRTIRGELNYWFQFGDLNYSQTLKILCVNTPQAIFPKRKIGRIADGYEASFIVLSDNPLTNLLKLRAIAYKVKDGLIF
ncbi:MAG: amidohydrolase family protein [Saprospiraceae bacterium]|nr:amidohydrolase family protein [Saprospiraceae bacterium]